MSRHILTLSLASILVVTPVLEAFDRSHARLTLGERLDDMPGEVARFLAEGEHRWQEGQVDSSSKTVRLKAQLELTEDDSMATLVLESGTSIPGRLLGYDDTKLELSIEVNDETRAFLGTPGLDDGVRVHRDFPYAEIASAELDLRGDWEQPRKLQELSSGKKIDVLNVNGKTVGGKLETVSDTTLRLEVNKEVVDIPIDEIVAVDVSFPVAIKAGIIVAAVVGGLALLAALAYAAAAE